MSISPKNEASQNNTAKRRDYISWDEYFMGIAMLSAMRSKDPNSQVGACIVRDNKILSLGYNGMPIGCDDDIMPWGREGNELETKYMYVCHSELNAILNAGKDLHGSTMYVTLFPCNECAKECVPLSRILRKSECDTIEPSPHWRRLFFVYRQIPVSGNFSLNVA